MSRLRLGTNFAVFVIFFGLALLEAFQSQNYLKAILLFLLGLLFLYADNKK